jgi:hypothetical protein
MRASPPLASASEPEREFRAPEIRGTAQMIDHLGFKIIDGRLVTAFVDVVR